MNELMPDTQPMFATRPPIMPMVIHAMGPEADAEVRQICSGHFPRVGMRFVLVCTAVHTSANAITAQFQLVPLEDEP